MPHDQGLWLRTLVKSFHFAGEVAAEDASKEEDSRQEEVALNEALDPSLELLLALDVEASVEVLVLDVVRRLRLV
jgi:hypothetical protein